MKGIIRGLANIFGVTDDIIKEERTKIGFKLRDHSHLYNGGLKVHGSKPDVRALLWIYGESLIKLNKIPDVDQTRTSIFGKDYRYEKALKNEGIDF